MEAIDQWFNDNCPYFKGVELYETIPGRNANILRFLKLKESVPNLEKLKYELGKFRPIAIPEKKELQENSVITKTIKIEASAIAVEKKQQLMFHNLPPELRPVLLKANELFRKNCYLKVTLNDLPINAEAEALKIQIEISENFQANELCWKKIDYWLEHRQLPKEITLGFDQYTPAQLVKRQQYLFQNISKMKKRFEENLKLLSSTEDTAAKSRIQRMVAKQDGDLIKKNEELQIITRLINGK